MKSGHAFLKAALCVCWIWGFSNASAEEKLRLYYISLPGLLEGNDAAGPLGFALRELSRRSGVAFEMRRIPMNRLIRELKNDKPAVGVPQLGAMVRQRFKRNMRLSPPIVFRCDFAFVRQGAPVPRTAEDLKGLVLVTTPLTQLPPPIEALAGLTILEAPTFAAALQVLSSGRADVWINDKTTTIASMKATNFSGLVYDAETPLYVWPAHMVYSSAVDERVRKRLDTAIIEMAKNGSLLERLPNNFVQNYAPYITATGFGRVMMR